MANEFKVKKGLIVNGSGSVILDVRGSQGQLFSVTDNLSGSLFSVADISGVPVFDVFSSGRVGIGTSSPAERLHVYGGNVLISGSSAGTELKVQDGATGAPIRLSSNGSGEAFLYIGGENSSLRRTGGDLNLFANSLDIKLSTNNGSTATLFLDTSHNATFAGSIITSPGATDQTASHDDADTPSTTGAEFLRIQHPSYTNGQYTTEFAKIDRSGNLPVYIRQSKGTANSFSNIARFGDHDTNNPGVFAVFGDMELDGFIIHGGDTDTKFGFNGANDFKVHTGGSNRFSVTGDVHVLGPTDFAIPAGRKLYLDGQSNTYITETSDGVIDFYGDGVQLLTAKQNGTQSEVVVNEGSGDVDFRVEANKEDHAFFVEALDSGSVGIGTNDPSEKFHVLTSNNTVAKFESTDANANIRIGDTVDNTHIGTDGGKTYIGPDTSVGGNNITILSDGKVGIGTGSPDYKLDVAGTIRVGSGGTIQPLLSRDSATGGLIVSSVNNSGDFIFKGTGGNEKFRITDGGKVGIGTDNPTANLEVAGAGAQLRVGPRYSSGGDRDFVDLIANGTDSKVKSDNERFHIENSLGHIILSPNDKVGIGTTSPNAKLEIVSDGSAAGGAEMRLTHANNNSTDVVSTVNFANNVGSVAMIQGGTTSGNTNGYISFFTDNSGTSSEKMRIVSDGKVGIGTTGPARTLDIVGNLGLTGDIIGTGTDVTLTHSSGPSISIRRSDSSISTDDRIGGLFFQGDDPTDGVYDTAASIQALASTNWSSNNNDTRLEFAVKNNATLQTGLAIKHTREAMFSDSIGIGVTPSSSIPSFTQGGSTTRYGLFLNAKSVGVVGKVRVAHTTNDLSGVYANKGRGQFYALENKSAYGQTGQSNGTVSITNDTGTTSTGIAIKNTSTGNTSTLFHIFRSNDTGTGGTFSSGLGSPTTLLKITGQADMTVGINSSNSAVRAENFYSYAGGTTFYLKLNDTGTSLNARGDVVAFASSDIRMKEDIRPLENSLGKLDKIKGVKFKWNNIHKDFKGKEDIGVIAQDVEKVLPEIVTTRDTGYKAVDYQKLSVLLIESIKELKKEVEELKKKINK